jgi:hypothetical protein
MVRPANRIGLWITPVEVSSETYSTKTSLFLDWIKLMLNQAAMNVETHLVNL